jgi:hypothetical protein
VVISQGRVISWAHHISVDISLITLVILFKKLIDLIAKARYEIIFWGHHI